MLNKIDKIEDLSLFPYGVIVSFTLWEDIDLLTEDEVVWNAPTGHKLKLLPKWIPSHEINKKYKGLNLCMEGFKTASEAEATGKSFVLGLLWHAISENIGLRLDYNSPLPCKVYNRSNGGFRLEAHAEARVYGKYNNTDFISATYDSFVGELPLFDKLALSMELFCQSKFETSPNSRFLSLMNSLEALVQQEKYGENVKNFVTKCVDLLESFQDIKESSKVSLKGRLKDLERQSVRQAIKKLINTHCISPEAFKKIDTLYKERSKLVHEAEKIHGLNQKCLFLENCIRRTHAGLLKRKLYAQEFPCEY